MIRKPLRIIVLLLFIVLQSCSKDDDGSSNTSYFLNVEVQGTNLSATSPLGFASSPEIDCQTNDEILEFLNIGQIDTSQYFMDVFLAHYEDSSNFSDDINQQSNVIEFIDNRECYENFDFQFDFVLNDNRVNLDSSSNNTSQITNIESVESNSQQTTYAISGKFNLTFLDIDNSPVVVTGEYRIPVSVLN